MNPTFVSSRAVISLQALLCLVVSSQAASAAALILGDTTGNARGSNAVDVQSARSDATQIAAGVDSIAIGQYNKATGDNGVSIGFENVAGLESIAIGFINSSTGLGYAFGYNNIIGGGSTSGSYRPSGAFGLSNAVNAGADFSFVFGRDNTIQASDATVFGSGITNSTAGSTMIGPSNTAKVTILSSGNVGIGTAAPTSKLHVVGDLNVTGSIINPMLSGSGSGSTSRLRVGGTTTPSASWQGTAAIGADGQNKVITGYLASSTNGAVIGAHNSALNAWADLNVAGANLIFRTSETERMRINSSGNVGIGTSSPAGKLHVMQDVTPTTFDRFGTGQKITITTDASSNRIQADSITSATKDFELISGGTSPGSIGLNPAGARAVTIATNGSVGVGTTTPAAKLDVNGTVQIAGDVKVRNNAVIRISPAGDIGMGGFLTGTNPAN